MASQAGSDYGPRASRRGPAPLHPRDDPPQNRYYADEDEDGYPPPKRSNRDPKPPRYLDEEENIGLPPPRGVDLRKGPSPVQSVDPRDVEPNMKVPRGGDDRKPGRHPVDDDEGIQVVKGRGDRGHLERKNPRNYDSDEDGDDGYDRRRGGGGRTRGYEDDDRSDARGPPRRSNTVRERPSTYDDPRDRDRDRRRGGDDRYGSDREDLGRSSGRKPPPREYDRDDRDRGYKSDGRDARRRRDRYDDYDDRERDRGYRSGGGDGRRRDPYDDRDAPPRRSDRDRGYRSGGDDYRSSRRGYESDRGSDRYSDSRRDRDRDRDRYGPRGPYDDRRDRDRDRYSGGRNDRHDRYDDRDRDRERDRDRSGSKKKKGFSLNPNDIPRYIEQGQKHYKTVKPLVDSIAGMYLGKKLG